MPYSLTVFALVVLAVARATRLITTDSLTRPLRDKLGERALAAYRRDEQATDTSEREPSVPPRAPGERGLYALVTCPWCIGFWLSMLAYVLIYAIGTWPSTLPEWALAIVLVASTSWLVGALNTRYAR
ncbi:DUF1360 domain-containing protein [Streptomyces sp. LHD-70]|uniref:DUF1360 domain-containing protein n=1 Tax=Streptomyces sp. LHD-70 TaxID=3072140 RepID=UPI00280D8639|nr:DUF1360 domain-containing protein [Streptomyces sp. LHD-70]MDQ8706206.1 DUF1360 domain-containing protein [Streptomyces sp. LHD-70]